MKILLLGANGFIGKHIALWLERSDYNVLRADINSDGDRACILIDPVHPDFEALFGSEQYDICINCSGAASVPESLNNPFHDFTLNTMRIAEILEGMRLVSPETRFIHLSSAAVYGNPVSFPIMESDPVNPVSPYGWHKLQAEEICREYSSVHGVKTLSMRIFSAYGPGLRKQLFWDVYQKALKNERIELFGTGNETRDFIYVDDIAACINILIRNSVFDGRAVNIASGEATSVRTAVTTLLEALGWQREIVFSGEGRSGDPRYWQADVSYMKELGFVPAYSLRNGMGKVASWMIQQ